MVLLFKKVKIRSYEIGLYFRDGEFQRLLTSGQRWLFDPLRKVRVDVVSQRDPWLKHDKLDVIVKSGALADLAQVVDLKDYERALVWIEGRFSRDLPPSPEPKFGARIQELGDIRRRALLWHADRSLQRKRSSRSFVKRKWN